MTKCQLGRLGFTFVKQEHKRMMTSVQIPIPVISLWECGYFSSQVRTPASRVLNIALQFWPGWLGIRIRISEVALDEAKIGPISWFCQQAKIVVLRWQTWGPLFKQSTLPSQGEIIPGAGLHACVTAMTWLAVAVKLICFPPSICRSPCHHLAAKK